MSFYMQFTIQAKRNTLVIKNHFLIYIILHKGMKHDADVGCNGKEGFMSGTAGMWSTCSRKALLDHYNSMKSAGKWCLAGNSYSYLFSKESF